MEQDPIQLIAEVRDDLDKLEGEHGELREYVLGPKGDIQKGLVWMSTMQGQMLLTLEKLVTAQTDLIQKHVKDQALHVRTDPDAVNWRAAWVDIAKSVIVTISVLGIVAIVGFTWLGAKISLAGGPRP